MKVSKKVAGVEYAIRDIVSAAREIEKQGKTVDYLNIGDPVQFGFHPPENVKQAYIDAIKKGYKSYIIFLVQIQGIEYFKIAKDIDNEYYQNYLIAKKAGVNFLAYRCKISPKEIKVEKKIKIIDE